MGKCPCVSGTEADTGNHTARKTNLRTCSGGGTPVAPLAYSKALVDAYFAWIKQNLTRRLCERGDRKYNFTRR